MSAPIEPTTARTFMLPDLGEGLTEAEVVEWQVSEGDEVRVDQIVVTVETAKASVDLPCPYAGRVLTLHGLAGAVLEVGRPLLTIGLEVLTAAPLTTGVEVLTPAPLTTGVDVLPAEPLTTDAETKSGSGSVLIGYGTSETKRSHRRRVTQGGTASPVRATPSGLSEPSKLATPSGRATPSGLASPSGLGAPSGLAVVASAPRAENAVVAPVAAPKVISPVVRKLARDKGVDLTGLAPTGPGGIVRRADVEAAFPRGEVTPVAAAPVAPVQGEARADRAGDIRIPLRGVRRAIAEKMTTSRREIPEVTTWVDVDATALMAAKDEIKLTHPGAGIGLLALVARITVAGLKKFPELNSRVDLEAQEIVQLRDINLSFAAQSPRGLMVPVVHGAGQMTTTELAAALRELTDLARTGTLSPAQMSGGTFTLNNYGVFGVDGSTPIINYPEAAMLGVGRIIDRPWAHEGELALRKVTQLSFTFDHRVCDGAIAGGFLRFVADCVERPTSLLALL